MEATSQRSVLGGVFSVDSEIDQLIDQTPGSQAPLPTRAKKTEALEASRPAQVVPNDDIDDENDASAALVRTSDDDTDSMDDLDDGPQDPWHVRMWAWLRAFPHRAWHWTKHNRVKAAILLVVLGLLVFACVEAAMGAVTSIMTGLLLKVQSLGPAVSVC